MQVRDPLPKELDLVAVVLWVHFLSDKRKCLYFLPNEMKADNSSRYEVGCHHILFRKQFFGSLKLPVFLIC